MKTSLSLLAAAAAVCGVFLIAGSWAWWNAWVLLVIVLVLGAFTTRLFRRFPGLAEERRSAAAKAKPWDVSLVRMINLALPAMLVLAGLEIRFAAFPAVPVRVSVAAFVAMIPAALLTYRAVGANPFFSSHVRIQDDRGHSVVSVGPYRWVRHPGYAGSIAFNLLTPLALGSWLALGVGCVVAVLLLYRTAKEDATLCAELPGYVAYSQQVRCRLIPGIW